MATPTERAHRAPTDSLSRTSSWVLRHKASGRVVMETFDPAKVAALNTVTYEAVPILQYLGELNRALAAERRAQEDYRRG